MGARPPTFAQSPRRQPHQEGVTETSVSVERGLSETLRLGRGEMRLPFRKVRERHSLFLFTAG